MSFLQSNTLFYLKDILPITTIAGGTFRISGELETGNPIETGGLDTFIVLKNGTQIERMSVTMTGGIATIVKRGLQQDGVTENSALKKPWNDGTIAYITIKPKDLLGSGSTDIDFTFNGNVLFNKSIRYPVYADATARDLAITSPTNGMWIYNTALGVNQQYIGGAWTNNASGSVVNADTSTAGKVEIATQAEFDAGTDVGGTGATLVAPPSVVNTISTMTYIAGEALTQNDVVIKESLYDFRIIASEKISITPAAYIRHNELALGDTATRTIRSTLIIGNGVSVSSIKLALRKNGTPVDNLTVRIETDNAGNPSGTLANANASGTVAGASLSSTATAITETTVSFSGAFTLTDGQVYHIVIGRSGGIDNTNHYVVGYINGVSCRGFLNNNHNGTGWQTASSTPESGVANSVLSCTFTGAYLSVMVKASASIQNTMFFDGIAKSSYAIGVKGFFHRPGMRVPTFSGLIKDSVYFLSNTPGNISTTAGTNPMVVGVSDITGSNLILRDSSENGVVSPSIQIKSSDGVNPFLFSYKANRRVNLSCAVSGGSGVTWNYMTKNGVSVAGTTFQMEEGDIFQMGYAHTNIAPTMTLNEFIQVSKLKII